MLKADAGARGGRLFAVLAVGVFGALVWAERRRLGLVYWLQARLGLSDLARDAPAVALMDYTLYV